MMRKVLALGTATVTAAVAAVVVLGPPATAHDTQLRAKLRDVDGRLVGTVDFRVGRDSMVVDARLRPNRYVEAEQFHGFHVHANDNEANGTGCVADAAANPSTWFVSADGHLSESGQGHGAHAGDMPSPLVLADGSARLSFSTDRIEPDQLRRRAVILHAGADNFNNVPTGTLPNQYTPNSDAAVTLTANTGNAGNRMACGLIRRSW